VKQNLPGEACDIYSQSMYDITQQVVCPSEWHHYLRAKHHKEIERVTLIG
jgi:hypothetical protein